MKNTDLEYNFENSYQPLQKYGFFLNKEINSVFSKIANDVKIPFSLNLNISASTIDLNMISELELVLDDDLFFRNISLLSLKPKKTNLVSLYLKQPDFLSRLFERKLQDNDLKALTNTYDVESSFDYLEFGIGDMTYTLNKNNYVLDNSLIFSVTPKLLLVSGLGFQRVNILNFTRLFEESSDIPLIVQETKKYLYDN